MSKQKKILIAAALLVVVALIVGVYFTTRPQTVEGAKTITVTVIHADGTEKTFTYHTDEVYLGPVLVAEGLVEGHDSEYGLMIDSVDGEKAVWEENSAYWALYVGEDYGSNGVDSTPIANGDTFKLIYTVG